jgi:2-haloacid dehalogenase
MAANDPAAPMSGGDFDWVAFDAYGTLFDITGEDWAAPEVIATFRQKQVQYTWLVTLMEDYHDFDQVSRAAIEYAAAAHSVDLDIEDVLGRQVRIRTFPEVPDALERMRVGGRRLAIVSNGRPDSLNALARNAGVRDRFAAIVSVHPLRVFKPSPRVYRNALEELGVEPNRLLFVSSNGWDVAGAISFGLRVCWVNRAGAPAERIGGRPELEVRDLSELAAKFD